MSTLTDRLSHLLLGRAPNRKRNYGVSRPGPDQLPNWRLVAVDRLWRGCSGCCCSGFRLASPLVGYPSQDIGLSGFSPMLCSKRNLLPVLVGAVRVRPNLHFFPQRLFSEVCRSGFFRFQFDFDSLASRGPFIHSVVRFL